MIPSTPFSNGRERRVAVFPAFSTLSLLVILSVVMAGASPVFAQLVALHKEFSEKKVSRGPSEAGGGAKTEVLASVQVGSAVARSKGESEVGAVVVESASSSRLGASKLATSLRLSAIRPHANRSKVPGSKLSGPDVVDRSSYEWMQLNRLPGPSEFVSSVHSFQGDRADGCATREDLLEMLDLRLNFAERPAYVPRRGHAPMIDRSPRPISTRSRAFLRLAHKELYRHVRRLAKKEWRHRFRDSTWSFDEYHEGISRINAIGTGETDWFNIDYYYNTARNDALREDGLEGERERTIVRYGPLGINNHGSLAFDIRSLVSMEKSDLALAIDPESEDLAADDALSRRVGTAADPVFTGSWVRFRPRVKVKVDPIRGFSKSAPEHALRSYGGSLQVDFFSDIAKRQLFSLEGEVKVRRNKEYGFFLNFVIEGWR